MLIIETTTKGGKERTSKSAHVFKHHSNARPLPGFAFGGLHLFPRGVDAEKDEEEDGEAPERRATVAEEG